MSWTRTRNLYLNILRANESAELLDEKSSVALSRSLEFIQGDKFTVAIWFRTPDDDTSVDSVVAQLPAGSVIVLAGKLTGALGASTVLFSCTSFAEAGTGDDIRYEGTLDLNTSELSGALLAYNSVEIRVDIEVENADNSERMTFKLDATVHKQAYSNEADPIPGTPTYPSPSMIVVKNGGTQAITNGLDYVEITGLALDFIPAQIMVSVRKPAGGVNLFATIRDASITADGFIADLSAAAPATGYKLDYLPIEAP